MAETDQRIPKNFDEKFELSIGEFAMYLAVVDAKARGVSREDIVNVAKTSSSLFAAAAIDVWRSHTNEQ